MARKFISVAPDGSSKSPSRYIMITAGILIALYGSLQLVDYKGGASMHASHIISSLSLSTLAISRNTSTNGGDATVEDGENTHGWFNFNSWKKEQAQEEVDEDGDYGDGSEVEQQEEVTITEQPATDSSTAQPEKEQPKPAEPAPVEKTTPAVILMEAKAAPMQYGTLPSLFNMIADKQPSNLRT